MLLTPNFISNALQMRNDEKRDTVSISVPISPWLRSQLDRVERFVQDNVNIPSKCVPESGSLMYRALWPHESMFISVSRWCNIFVRDAQTGTFKNVNINNGNFGHGTYSVTIEIPYVYIGAHKHGEVYSLTLRAVQIVYEPLTKESNLASPLDTTNALPTILPKTVEKKGRKRKKKDDDDEVSTQLPETATQSN